MTTQPPGHIFGPTVPHVAFYYGDIYLGETRYPFKAMDQFRALEIETERYLAVEIAADRLTKGIEMLNPGPEARRLLGMLDSRDRRVRIYY